MCDKADKCAGNEGPDSPVKNSGGFFSMFGGGSVCSTCGNSKCTCNSNLTEHLKKCAGLGNLPPLYQKCDDIPGPEFRDRVPRSTCTEKDKDECYACGRDKPGKGCAPPKKDECAPKDAPKEKCCDNKGANNKCPPMPVADCSDCKPAWINCTPNLTRTYPVPEGVEILPISIGGRNGAKSDACGKCGQGKDKENKAKPKVANTSCPMMKPRCPGFEQPAETNGGFFAKLLSLFGKK